MTKITIEIPDRMYCAIKNGQDGWNNYLCTAIRHGILTNTETSSAFNKCASYSYSTKEDGCQYEDIAETIPTEIPPCENTTSRQPKTRHWIYHIYSMLSYVRQKKCIRKTNQCDAEIWAKKQGKK